VFRSLLNKRCSNKASVALMLKSSVQIFYDSHHNLVDLYEIYISQILMDNFLRRFCLSSVTDKTFIGLDFIYIWVTRRVSYKMQELLTLREHLGSPPVCWSVRIAHSFLFSVLCFGCPMLPVSLDCPFLIAPSVFSNVYLPFVIITILPFLIHGISWGL
jgi:hypothetical protein